MQIRRRIGWKFNIIVIYFNAELAMLKIDFNEFNEILDIFLIINIVYLLR